MLFYVKKYLALELAVTLLLGGLGWWGIQYFSLRVDLRLDLRTAILGIATFVVLSTWNLGIQRGYRLIKGREYAEQITHSLAKEFSDASILQMLLGGITAAIGEELFFRGFIQTKFGILSATILFGLAHFGKKDIRVVSLWSFAQGFLLGLAYLVFGRLAVPMIAHGLFDISGFIYFRWFMLQSRQPA